MRRFALAMAAAMLLPAVPASAAAVFTENFDSYKPTLDWNGSGVWTTANVDMKANGTFFLTCVGGSGNCVDLSGSKPGSISKEIALEAGTYSLSFDYTGNQRNNHGGPFPIADILVSIGDLTDTITPLSNASAAYTTYTALFTVTGPATLTFAQGAGGNTFRGNIIDNVSISSVVPEASSWAMMIGGFGIVGGTMRRRTGTKTAVV